MKIFLQHRVAHITIALCSAWLLLSAPTQAASINGLTDRSATFLKPLKVNFVVKPMDSVLRPQFCGQLSRAQCPPIVSSGGVAGGIPTIDPAFKADLPNVRVSIFIQGISNVAVSGGGVSTGIGELVFINWSTTGSEADDENGGPYGWALPEPGETLNDFGSHASINGAFLIYDALVMNACDSFSSFPVQHQATVTERGADIGAFNGVDNSTIDSTGYYNLSYIVRAEDIDGGVSDFHFEGIVSATCSGQNSL